MNPEKSRGCGTLNGVVLIIHLNEKSILKFDNCNNDGLEAYLRVSNLQAMMFDNTLSSCCIVNLKVSIIRGGGGGYVINKEILEYPLLLSLWCLKSSEILEF